MYQIIFWNKYPVNFILRTSNQPNNVDETKHQFQSLTSADDEAFDLNDLEYQKAINKHNQEKVAGNTSKRQFYRWARGEAYDPVEGDKELIKHGGRPRGLLLIYPVVTELKDKNPLIGLALSFPKTRNAGHGLYTISNFDYERMNELY